MQAGKLRSRVSIESPAIIKDGRGQDVETFSIVLDNVAADVRQLVGRELMNAMAVESEATWRVVVRWQQALAGLTTKHRVRYGSKVLDIIAWNNVEQRNRTIQIDAKEHV